MATIAELRRDKEMVARVIASLEELQTGKPIAAPRRGRKSMSAEERQEVSARRSGIGRLDGLGHLN